MIPKMIRNSYILGLSNWMNNGTIFQDGKESISNTWLGLGGSMEQFCLGHVKLEMPSRHLSRQLYRRIWKSSGKCSSS